MLEQDIVNRCLTDHKFFIETFISLKDKKRFIAPFIFNPIQEIFYEKFFKLNKIGVRNHIILKPRQLGFTTLICALFLSECILIPNTTAAIIAHDAESTARIFEITKLMYEKLPDEIRPAVKRSSKRELVFDSLNSKIFIGTAGSAGFGRGTTINLLHCSEFSFWENPADIMPSLLETIPKDNGVIIYETTANGYNHFHDMYQEAVKANDQDRKLNQIPYPHFYRWFDHPEYHFDLEDSEKSYIIETLSDEEKSMMKVHALNLEQIAWRRSKQQSLKDKFLQEYPEDDASCFISSGKPFFDRQVIKSVKLWIDENKVDDWKKMEMDGKVAIYKRYTKGERYIICADPAEGNPTSDNSSAYVLRLNMEPMFVEFCAEISDKLSMPKFYKYLYHLGSLYGFPKLVIERNNHGHLLCYWASNGFFQDQIKLLNRYPNIYIAKDNKPGFLTTTSTRPLILDNLSELLRNNMLVIYSKIWLDQALSFVYNDSGRPEAESGKHDDSIMATAVGSFILINEKQTGAFKFLNRESFGGHTEPNPPKVSVYDNKRIQYSDLHPMDNNILLTDTAELIDYKRFLGD